MRTKKQSRNRNTNGVVDSNHLLNDFQNSLKIGELLPSETGCDPFIFNMTSKVFSKIENIQFTHEFEEKTISITHQSLFGFIYQILVCMFKEMGKGIDPKRVEDLVCFNLTNFFLFFKPVNITEDEEKWVESELSMSDYNPNGVLMDVSPNHKRYYLINIKRILEKNKRNPEFNKSIVDFLKRDNNLTEEK